MNYDNQFIYPAYSCEHLLAPPSFDHVHYKSVPNVIFHHNGEVRIIQFNVIRTEI